MAQSLYEKGRALVLGNLHSLLNKAIDVNSVPVLEQYIRDLEEASETLESQADGARANLTTLTNRVTKLTLAVDNEQIKIDTLLTDDDETNDHFTVAMEQKKQGFLKDIAAIQGELGTATTLSQGLDQASKTLATRLGEMQLSLNRLRTIERSAKATEDAARTLGAAANLANTGAGVSVDDVAARLEQRADAAGERLKTSMGKLQGATAGGDAAVADTLAKQALAKRKAELLAKKAAGGAA